MLRRSSLYLAGTTLALLLRAPAAQAQAVSDSLILSLDSLLHTRISSAAKYQQTMSEAASSVTIITADDIQRYGYRTLPDVLAGVRGFYISYDRNYAYLGARGFSRPSDYNNRILILVDGNAMNEGVFGSSAVGTDFNVALSSLERIEIVRGPGSALYGTGAVFAVINLVTKAASRTPGASLAVQGGSYGERGGTLQYRGPVGRGLGLSLVGSWDGSDGHDLFFPEYQQPGLSSGIAHDHDWERRWSVLGSMAGGGLTLHGAFSSRTKAIPTGAFDTDLNGTPNQTRDDRGFVELRFERAVDATRRVSARAYFNDYRYDGYYTSAGNTSTDGARDQAVGGEAMLQWDVASANRLTVGGEVRRDLKSRYFLPLAAPHELDFNIPNTILSAYVQDEYQIAAPLSLLLGVRHDAYETTENASSPRLGLILTPSGRTTVKLLYGASFRAPSTYEASVNGDGYKLNPNLEPERARTLELAGQQRLANGLLGNASLFLYKVEGLIDLTVDPADSLFMYRNTGDAKAIGFEVELEGRLETRGTGYLSYTFQNARDEAGVRLSNSPVHMLKSGAGFELARWLGASVQSRYESGRRTVYGTSTDPSMVTDLHLLVPAHTPARSARSLDRLQLSLRVSNLFDASWATPGGVEHRQAAIVQDGRTVSAEVRCRF
jgi:iron complex outermembrane receptor protein